MVKTESNRVWAFLAALAIVIAVATAPAAGEVTSVNAVGYMKVATYESENEIECLSFEDGIVIIVTDMILQTGDDLVQASVGLTERNTVSASLTAICDPGVGPLPCVLDGPMVMDVGLKADSTTGTFATEIVSMSLSGNVGGLPITIRESPFLQSAGQLSVTDIGGGLYHIDSFFDVFTELSVDGGEFTPSMNLAHFNITPEPATMAVLSIGGLVLLRRKKK